MKIHSTPIDLRDLFANAAMQGMQRDATKYDWTPAGVAQAAYAQADAMIAEREKGSVETVDSTKQKLIDAINRKYQGLGPEFVMTIDHLIFQLETGKPF
ncbi:hypothetical protein [Acinetobacter soli]|uniref:hypothetical protein n=1 Tax=Acinetobacter soli TaxID=487316 RepID=UPI0026E0EEFB|nr:hypothetical protein [Acinetobacter soli]